MLINNVANLAAKKAVDRVENFFEAPFFRMETTNDRSFDLGSGREEKST